MYTLFKVLLIVGIHSSASLQGVINLLALRDAFPYWLARGIPLKEAVP
jgi:hypothetical protein